MPTFVYMTRCDGCGKCVDICPSDIMHIDTEFRRAFNLEPDFCWECYSCVKECPQHAIDVRGYADFAPLGHSVRVLREPEKRRISWKITYRNGEIKQFTFPVRTTEFGSLKLDLDHPAPDPSALASQHLAHEPEMLKVGELPTLDSSEREKKGGG
jgi:adenylylsulfate reductase subunit B